MSRQNSVMAAVATALGATLGGLLLWWNVHTHRKRLTQCSSPSLPSAAPPCHQKEPVQAEPSLPSEPQPQRPLPSSQQRVAVESDLCGLVVPPSRASPAPLPSLDEVVAVRPEVVDSPEEWGVFWTSFQQDLLVHPVLGLTYEWVRVKGKPSTISLLQLASYTGRSVVVRLKLHPPTQSSAPSSLAGVLCDPHVLKVGVGCVDEAKRLAHDHGLVLCSTLDLRPLALRVRPLHDLSLQSLSSDLLDVHLDKSLDLRCNDCEAGKPSPEQMSSGALKAKVSVALFLHLIGLLRERNMTTIHSSQPIKPSVGSSQPIMRSINSRQPIKPSAESRLPLSLQQASSFEQLVSCCQDLVDAPFRDPESTQTLLVEHGNASTMNVSTDSMEMEDQQVPELRDVRKSKRKSAGHKYSPRPLNSSQYRKSPLYDNCFLQAPDGQLLCTCDRKKADWYLKKGIGDLESENPFIVRLLFEPSVRPKAEVKYDLVVKENICVVCGSADSYIKKSIIPHEYRRYFPDKIKNHNSHDILLLCTSCHATSCSHDEKLKQQLAQEHGAPQGCEDTPILLEDSKVQRVRSAAQALLQAQEKPPDAFREKLQHTIISHLEEEGQKPQVTQETLQELGSMDSRILGELNEPHGLRVVKAFAKKGLRGLMELEQLWRRHFLVSMKPHFLPKLWSINYNHIYNRYLVDHDHHDNPTFLSADAEAGSPQSTADWTPSDIQ